LAITATLPAQVPAQNIFPTAGFGVTFTNVKSPIDVGARGIGIQFYVKSDVAVSLQLQMGDIWTDPDSGSCTTTNSAAVENVCYNYPTAICTVPADTTTWSLCRVFFSSANGIPAFARQNWGNLGAGEPVDSGAATLFQITPPLTPAGLAPITYHISIDDISFIPAPTP
jgi:hypothetical protein